ncbi:MAG TPA: peptidoglycan DD-metalloendopeptidase family protein [Micromonosporaceae bacterium]|nr:peptidoglycan DD-metalloendopeptidase family protein [Micromonosporaceae bacterium]
MSVPTTVRRLLVGASCGVLLTTLAATAPVQAAPPDTLAASVTNELLRRADTLPGFTQATAQDTRVTVNRSQGRWAFGTAVLIAPRVEGIEPRDWLFLAERRAAGWRLAFDGEQGFGTLSARAPLISARERQIFASHDGQVDTQANGDYRTGMRLPWAVGQSWTLRGGPHAWDAGTGPWSSLDLVGGDQIVRAARAGTAYTTCTGRILVYHDRGYTTRYYHLWNYGQFDGTPVAEGARLGDTGTETGCGGSASSRHVHFSLLQNGNYVAVSPHIIGKWVPMNGGAQYGGYALHGSTRVDVGGLLYNYGALGFNQGIVDVSGTLNKRSGPGTSYPIVGTVADGTTVTITCSSNGTSHSGRWWTTSRWEKLSDGTWVSGAYVYTGLNAPVSGAC